MEILLIILVLSVTFVGLNIKEDFSPGYLYIPVKNTKTPFSKIFNIDDEIAKQPENLGWKSFWRKNYSCKKSRSESRSCQEMVGGGVRATDKHKEKTCFRFRY